MLPKAMEAVTRAFYARGDLDLILSSSASAARLFAVRIATMAVAISVMLTIALFRAIGPKRTRLVAQIVAAVIGASFVIGVQLVAILSVGTLSRVALFQSDAIVDHAPDRDSLWWLPANAAMGDGLALLVVLALGAIVLAGAIRFCAPRFGELALAAGGVSHGPARSNRRAANFRPKSPGQALRRKEWLLLWRDPWLMSQSLMQLLYLLPPFFLLSRMFYGEGNGAALLVPVLIMAAGQLAGGLAWLAISGEDAPDLIATAPVTAARVWRAKGEAVAGGMAIVFGPSVIGLAILDPVLGIITVCGITIAGIAATLIQFWFRAQVKRSLFRRRHVSSRIATFAEALSSIIWAGAGAVAVVSLWFAIFPGAVALAVLPVAWLLSPKRR